MTNVLTPELMRQATFAQIGERVDDRIPGSDFMQSAQCEAETECWREKDGMWVCSPCIRRFSDTPCAASAPRMRKLMDPRRAMK